MEIRFEDGDVYELDVTLNYEKRLELVNEIITNHEKDFINYWENSRRVEGHGYAPKITLDILGGYLYYSSTKELNKNHNILTERQLRRRNGELEIPVGLFDETTENILKNYQEKHKKQKPIKSRTKFSQSKMHKLETIYIHPNNRNNKLIKNNPLLYKIFIDKIDGERDKLRVEESDYSEIIEINCFTKDDLRLPFIDKNFEYISKWCYVDGNNEFIFENKKYKIRFDYEFDQILCMKQNGNIYWLDNEINLVDNKYIEIIN